MVCCLGVLFSSVNSPTCFEVFQKNCLTFCLGAQNTYAEEHSVYIACTGTILKIIFWLCRSMVLSGMSMKFLKIWNATCKWPVVGWKCFLLVCPESLREYCISTWEDKCSCARNPALFQGNELVKIFAHYFWKSLWRSPHQSASEAVGAPPS